MDRLESLGNQLSQITIYDIKSMYNQAKNVVLNVSEMEAKVREATNDEPWGASSSLMQEIASGTFSFQHFNEIMPCIYARFMEKEARQWREIYKALQLLEYLIKHGSERVIDDARSHISTLKMLRNFHYIDDKGKDEGVNVRNRSRELVELLSDVEKIRGERRKAKANKHKYTGTGNDGGLSFSTGGSRYGGFGGDTLGSGSGRYGSSGYGERDYNNYGNGGGSSGGFRDDSRRGGFEEYNAGDDEVTAPRRSGSVSQRTAIMSSATTTQPKTKEPVKEVDLLGGFDEEDAFASGSTNTGMATNKALPSLSGISTSADATDDDFADFQAAPTSPPTAANSANKPNLLEMLSSAPPSSRPAATYASTPLYSQQPAASITNNTGIGMGMGLLSPSNAPQNAAAAPASTPSPIVRSNVTSPSPSGAAAKPSGNFDDLWTMSLGSSNTPAGNTAAGVKSIKDLEKEKANAAIWGQKTTQKPAQFGDFGGFGGSTGNASASAGGDDLLL